MNPFDNPRNKRWFDNFVTTLGLNPNDLANSAQSGGTISLPSDIQSIEDVRKRFSDQGLPIPEYLMEHAAESWEDSQEIILGKPVRQSVGLNQYGPVIPYDVLNKTRELESKGYVRIGDSVPHIENGKETNLWKEVWAKPKYGPVPQFGQDLDALELFSGLNKASDKEASRRDGDGNLVHPIQLGDAPLPYNGESFWKEEWDKSVSRMVNSLMFVNQPGTHMTSNIAQSRQEIDMAAPDMNPIAKAGMATLSSVMPLMDVYDDMTTLGAGYISTQQIPYLGIKPNQAAIERYEMMRSLDPDNIQSPDWAKRKESYKQARDAGELSFIESIFYESLTDPLVWLPGGEAAGLVGGLGKKPLSKLTAKEYAKVAANIESKAVREALGPTFKETNGLLDIWKTQSGGTGGVSSEFRAALNLVTFDPTVDIDAFGPNSVVMRQQFMDSGVLEEEADLLTRTIARMSVNVGDGNPDALAGQIQISKISDGAANSALEQTIEFDNLDAPIGFTFKISEPENTVTGLTHNFDNWMDLVDTIDLRSGYARKLIKAGFNPDDQTFSKNGLLDQLQGQNLLMPEGTEYGSFSGMRLHKEELIGLGIDSFIRNYRGDRIPMNELRQFMDQNRLRITEIKMEDLYSQGLYKARLGGAADHYGVIGLSLDLENMSPNSTIVRSMLQAEGDSLTSYLGHYGQNYTYLADPAASEFFAQSVDNMAQRAIELINPTGPSLTSIPQSNRHNIMMHGRFQIRTTSDGKKLFHMDEIQSDFFQSRGRSLTPEEFNRTFRRSLLTGPDNTLYWDVVDQNKKSGGWSMGRFGSYEENIYLPDGGFYTAESDSIFITPYSGITVSDESVKVLYDNIINALDSSLSGNPKVPNKGRSSDAIQGVLTEENFGAKIIEEELYQVGQDFIRVQILKQGDEVSQEGVEKAPIIRIANYKSNVSDTVDSYGEGDIRHDFYDVLGVTDLWDDVSNILLNDSDSIVRRSDKRPYEEDFWYQTRWSTDDILNNKTPYRIVKERDGYSIYLGGARPNIPGLMNKQGISMGEYETREGAAKAINNYLRNPTYGVDAFNLPSNFIFHEGNFATPVIRRLLFNSADEGAEVVTFSSAEELVNRYGYKAYPYAHLIYGRVMGEGVKPSGLINRETRKVITDVMRTAGWSRWSVNDTDKLMARIEVPPGARRIPYKSFEDGTVKPSASVGHSTGIEGALGRLKHALGLREVSGSAEEQVKLLNEMDSTILDTLDHIPWELTINDSDPLIREAILERLASADVGAMAEKLARKRRTTWTLDRAKTDQYDDALSVLDYYTQVINHGYKRDGLGIDNKVNNYINNMPENEAPAVLKALRDRRGLNSSKERANSFNLLNMIEFEGIPVTPRKNGTSNDDILRILLEESIDTVNPATDIISKLRHPIHIAPRQTDKVTAFNGVRLTDDLSNADVRKELGISHKFEDGAMPTLQEALKNVQMRLFQINDQAPRGGKVLGFVDFTNDGKYMVRLTEAADSHVAMHEVGHIFRRLLTEDQLRTAGEFSMGREAFEGLTNKNIWSREAEEAFADAFESYLRTGFTRNPQMRTVFERFKAWLKNIARAIKGSPHEEKLSPAMKEFFDDLLTPNKPSIRKIESSVPPHMIDEVKKFYGYRVASHNVADADGIDVIDRQFKVADEPPVTPPIEELDSLGSIEDTLDAAFVEDLYRKVGEGLSNIPLAGAVIKRINPTAAATDPLARALIVREILKGQGSQKATIAISKLRRLGSRQQIFGSVDDAGLLTDGPLAGKHLNDIRTRPDDYVLTPEQREWIDTADVLERAKLAMLKAEGIDIDTLKFEDGGQYAGRRVFQMVRPDGTIKESVAIGEKPIGSAQTYEKRRYYETAAEAIEDGFRYMEEDEALFRNLEAAYTQVADKRMVDYISANLNWRTTKVPENLIVDSKNAKDRLDKIELVIAELIRAKRGDQIHWQTRKAIEAALPELEGMLDDVSRITLEDLVEAGRIAADQPTSKVPRKGLIKKLFARVKELEDEIKVIESAGDTPPASLIADLNEMKRKLGFQKHMVAEAYKNYEATGNFEYTFSRAVSGILSESRVGAIDELLEITRGKPYQHKVGEKVYTRYTGGMHTELREEAIRTAQAVTREREALATGSYSETMVLGIPAFRGKIFLDDQPAWAGVTQGTDGKWRQRTGQDVVKAITDSMVNNHKSIEFLNAANTLNGAMRFFRLAGDMSLFGIQLLFLMGHATNPTGLIKSVVTGKALRGDFSDARNMTFLPKAIKAYVHSFIDPTVHAKYLDENAELLNRHPGVLLAGRGTEFTEFTRQMENSGFVRSRPIRITGNIARTIPGAELAGRGYIGFLRRSQTGFEAAMDIAGIEMLKALDDLGTDAAKVAEVDAFVNEFRGLADSQRLGVSAKQRQIESFALLAPRYNRAIAAMLADLGRGGIRGSQARRKMASGIAAISAMSVAISLARGEEPDEILEHFNPQSPAFMTWNVGGVNIGFGTKVRSLIKLSASIYMEMTDDEDMTMDKFLSMENPGVRFLRGNTSPLLGSSIDILSGRTYMGDPTTDSVMSFASNVVAPASMFIWTSSMLLEGGSMRQRTIRGMTEFLGGRSHPETMSQVLHSYSKDILGLDYDELEVFEKNHPDIGLRKQLEDILGPMQAEQLLRGSEYAKYYHERDELDKDRYKAEVDLVQQYMNPNTGSGIFLSSNADYIFKTKYNDIQRNYAIAIKDLNRTHERYQDDQEFDEDDPKGYVLQEWYNLYEKAYRTAGTIDDNDIYQGVFDNRLLAQLEKEYWESTLPNGEPMTNYIDFIHRNTGTTKHAPGVSTILGSDVQQQWEMTQKAQRDFLKDRGNWNEILDKSK